jgi:hypothetical protein
LQAETAREAGQIMLQTFLDASGSVGDSPVYVMAGYVAREEDWGRFVEDWNGVLGLEPRLKFLKMNQAISLDPKGQFRDWTEQQRDDRLNRLAEIINRHALYGIISIVPVEPYLGLFKRIFRPNALDRPYFLSFFGVMAKLVHFTANHNLSDRIDFTFDKEGGESEELMEEQFRIFKSIAPQHLIDLMGDKPHFGNDHELAQLQAADYIAWNARRYYHDEAEGLDPTTQPHHQFMKRLLNTEHILDLWTEEKLREVEARLRLGVFRQLEGIRMTLPDPSMPGGFN